MKGGCHCGAIRFEISEEPTWLGACHCVDCRKISGSPYTVFAGFLKKSLRILQGKPKKYASSKHIHRLFCEFCSSLFAYTHIDGSDQKEVFIPVGVFDNPNGFKPERHIWVSQKLPWVIIHDDLPQRDR